MSWRERFFVLFGPGQLGGITFGDWLRLLRANRFAIAPACWIRAVFISMAGVANSAFRCYEDCRYGAKYQGVSVEPPLFILGHWRSGTTHVHNLLAVDDRFAYPNLYQVFYPHTFLTTEAFAAKSLAPLLTPTRPMDNMRFAFNVPYEEEFVHCVAGFHSSYLSVSFPAREAHYDKYLTLRGVSPSEIRQWQAVLLRFVKKLTWKYRRPLVLKSPAHTCRLKRLLEMFPHARFVHIHRNPYVVFRSTRHMVARWDRWARLQRRDLRAVDDRILRQYREMYDAFFEERGLIPEGRFHEVCFEELERDPVGQMRVLYHALGLPEFGHVEQRLQEYVDSLSGYKKNVYPPLPGDLRQRIADNWRRCFDEWGYSP